MQNAHRFTFPRGRVTILALACLVVPLGAKAPQPAAPLGERELTKRRAAIQEAQELLTQGDQAYQAGRYADAVAAFSGAREMVPDSPLTAELRAAATQRFAQASVQHARNLSRKGDVAAAKAAVDAVLNPSIAPNDPGALAMRNQLDDPIRTNPVVTKEHSAEIDSVRKLLYTADGAFNLGDFNAAKNHYESVLRIDPTNAAARRGMEQVAAAKSTYQKSAVDHTRAEMLSEVAAAWETPVPAPILDVASVDPNVPEPTNSFVPVANKIDRIVIPNIILEDASLQDAIDLLRLRAAELDQIELDPAHRGINFHIDIGGETSDIGNKIRATRFNLRLTNVPISQVLLYINGQTQTTYTTDDFTVIIRPHGFDSSELVTRIYRVPPDFISNLSASSSAATTNDPFAAKPAKGLLTERRGALEVLREQGIQFPDGASASFNPTNSSLIVVNTAANQDIISQIVDAAAKTEPVMVCFRVTMIRVHQKRLEELGFDWLLSPIGFGGTGWIPGTNTLNFSGGTQGTGGSMSDINVPSNQFARDPITSGNRSGDEAISGDSIDALINSSTLDLPSTARAPGIFGVSKVLSDRSVQVLMRGLNQKKGVDVMTSASTVTRNGQASSVRSVREMIYPTEYEPPELPNSGGGNNANILNFLLGGAGAVAANNNNNMIVTPSHPSAFETREIGMVLEITPTVDDAKRFVDVTLNPSVTDFDGFVNYGSPIFAPQSPTLLGTIDPFAARSVLSDNRILMPVFSTHRTSTSLTVADGATIVIGGLLQDRIQNVEDQTPLFGALPLLGRLFQSKATQPVSTAVVFLVNVQLIDPTGQPFNKR
jgi:general secretion pathway protein D